MTALARSLVALTFVLGACMPGRPGGQGPSAGGPHADGRIIHIPGFDAGVPADGDSGQLPIDPRSCGNQLIEPPEVCDGNGRDCAIIDPQAYGGGVAPCKADCSGFDVSACTAAPPPATLGSALASITEQGLRDDLAYFSSDALNGRLAGSPGDQEGMAFIAKRFGEAGLTPGSGSDFKQPFSWSGKSTGNIVGVLEGNDPALADEVVVIGGHHDHMGTTSDGGCQNMGGNNICNGADDNGTGAMAVVHVAKALAQLKGQNRRTLLFITFGAEEQGLVGSQYYVDNPIYPLQQTVYMINIDMIGYSSSGEVQALGAGKSQLATSWIEDAASEHGVSPSVTNSAGGGSDHYHFALEGVPYVFFHTGIPQCYHATCDTVDRIHFDNYTKIVRSLAALMWQLAQADESPRADFNGYSLGDLGPDPRAGDARFFQRFIDHGGALQRLRGRR